MALNNKEINSRDKYILLPLLPNMNSPHIANIPSVIKLHRWVCDNRKILEIDCDWLNYYFKFVNIFLELVQIRVQKTKHIWSSVFISK